MPEIETPLSVTFTCVREGCEDGFATVQLTEALPVLCPACQTPAIWVLLHVSPPTWKAPRDYEPLELKPCKRHKTKRLDFGGEEASFVLVASGEAFRVDGVKQIVEKALDNAQAWFDAPKAEAETKSPCGCNHDDDEKV